MTRRDICGAHVTKRDETFPKHLVTEIVLTGRNLGLFWSIQRGDVTRGDICGTHVREGDETFPKHQRTLSNSF